METGRASEKTYCPCFREYVEGHGTCSLQKIPRDDNYSLGSCDFGGNAALCLIRGDSKVSIERLKAKLNEQVQKSKYFEKILEQS
jgi:hypothetical protein